MRAAHLYQKMDKDILQIQRQAQATARQEIHKELTQWKRETRRMVKADKGHLVDWGLNDSEEEVDSNEPDDGQDSGNDVDLDTTPTLRPMWMTLTTEPPRYRVPDRRGPDD